MLCRLPSVSCLFLLVVTALPDLHLPWKKGVLSSSMEALDEAVFKAGIKDSTAFLVDADVAAGNCSFGGAGDCENATHFSARRSVEHALLLTY